MDPNYIKNHEYQLIANKVLEAYISRYDFSFGDPQEFGVELKNNFVKVSISFRYREFQLIFFNGKKEKELTEFVFEKFPNYIEMVKQNPEKAIFNKTQAEREDAIADFSYCLVKSFQFLEENFPNVFKGKF